LCIKSTDLINQTLTHQQPPPLPPFLNVPTARNDIDIAAAVVVVVVVKTAGEVQTRSKISQQTTAKR